MIIFCSGFQDNKIRSSKNEGEKENKSRFNIEQKNKKLGNKYFLV